MKRFALFLLVLALIFISSACKKSDNLEFNIVGHWEIALTFVDNQQIETENYLAEFIGTMTEGTWVIDLDEFAYITGTYQVNGDLVQMTIVHANFDGITGTFTGRFENENKISGDWTVYDDGNPMSGTWIATRK